MSAANKNPYLEALAWHLDAGADEAVGDVPFDRTAATAAALEALRGDTGAPAMPSVSAEAPPGLRGRADAVKEARDCAAAAGSLDALAAAIKGFDGLSIRRTAANMVFASGTAQAKLMVIGDAPGADDDRQGEAFTGSAGLLADRMLAAIGLSRKNDVYMTNLLNWRPPGNRAPTRAEIELSLPFLERHIALARPRLLLVFGGVAGGALLGAGEAISRLRGRAHSYTVAAGDGEDASAIPAFVTYHPLTLLNNPAQKRQAWIDLQAVQARMNVIS